MYDFSVDYNTIDKSDILNIHKYLKIMFSPIKQVLIVLLNSSSSSARDQTEFMISNDESCMLRPTLFYLNPVERK